MYKFNVSEKSDENYYTFNPARPEENVGVYGITNEEDTVNQMLEKLTKAQQEWASVPSITRGDRVYKFIEAVENNVDRLAEAITLEQGKIFVEARNEVLKGCAEGKFICGEGARVGTFETGSGRKDVRNMVLHRPRGNIFAISPWNFPAMTPLRKICPALVFGNAILLKPSQFTPAAALILEEISKDFFPEGLFQVIICRGSFASGIIGSPKVDGLSFTGSVEVGRKVYSVAADNLIPVQLELGGKNAVIINDTKDMESCLDQVTAAAFQTGGQRCTSISRVIVNTNIKQQVVDGLAKRADQIKLGDGMDPEVQMGPLCNRDHWENVCEMTRHAIDEGAKAVAGGNSAMDSFTDKGFFYKPTILDNVVSKSIAGNEEIFGPVLSVIEYENFDQAIDILNDTPYGLTSSLFTDSNELIQKFLNKSLHGMLHVNIGTVPDVNMPFGGMKDSGVGPYSVGSSASNFYTIEQSAYVSV